MAKPIWVRLLAESEHDTPGADRLEEPPESSGAEGVFRAENAYVDREVGGDLRLFWNLRAESPVHDLKLVGEGDLGTAPFGPGLVDVDPSPRLLRLAVTGARDGLAYGAEYRLIPPGLANLGGGPLSGTRSLGGSKIEGDRCGVELWANRGLGPFRLRTALSQFSSNVEEDPRRAVITTTSGRVGVDARLPFDAVLGVSYERSLAETSVQPGQPAHQRLSGDSFGASLWYSGGPEWDVTLASMYTPSHDDGRVGPESASTFYSLSAAYRPVPGVTIVPEIAWQRDRYGAPTTSRQTPYLAVSLTYSPPSENVDVAMSTSYSRTTSPDARVDAGSLDVGARVMWTLTRGARGRQSVSLEISHSRYEDRVAPDVSYASFSALLRFRAAAF